MNFTLVHVGMLYMQYYSISCAVTWYIRHNKRSNMAWCPALTGWCLPITSTLSYESIYCSRMTKLRNLATCWASLPAPNHNMCLEWTQTSIIIIKTPTIYWWFQWHSLYKCPIFLFHHHYLTLAFINLSFCEDVLEWLYSLNVRYHENLKYFIRTEDSNPATTR